MQFQIATVHAAQPWTNDPSMISWHLVCQDPTTGQQRLIDINSRNTSPPYAVGQTIDVNFTGKTFADDQQVVWEKAQRVQNNQRRGGNGQAPAPQQYAPQTAQGAPPGYYQQAQQPAPAQQFPPQPPMQQGPPPGQFAPPVGQPPAQPQTGFAQGAPAPQFAAPQQQGPQLLDARDRHPIDRDAYGKLLVALHGEFFGLYLGNQSISDSVNAGRLSTQDLFREAGTCARTTIIAMQLAIPRE